KNFKALKLLGGLAPSSIRAQFARTVVRLLLAKKLEADGLISLIDSEIDATNDPHIIFRGNTFATKAMDILMSTIGMDYLRETIGPHIKAVAESKESCEIDPSRIENPEAMVENLKRLKSHTAAIWMAISKSVDNCPRVFVEIFNAIQSKICAKWGIEANVKYSAISGFIFLRFFCPAILSPNLFKLIDEFPDAHRARTFTLIAKIIQNLANLAEFGQKEQYLEDTRDSTEEIATQNGIVSQIELRRELENCYQQAATLTNEIELLHHKSKSSSADSFISERLLDEFKKLAAAHEAQFGCSTASENQNGSRLLVDQINPIGATSPILKPNLALSSRKLSANAETVYKNNPPNLTGNLNVDVNVVTTKASISSIPFTSPIIYALPYGGKSSENFTDNLAASRSSEDISRKKSKSLRSISSGGPLRAGLTVDSSMDSVLATLNKAMLGDTSRPGTINEDADRSRQSSDGLDSRPSGSFYRKPSIWSNAKGNSQSEGTASVVTSPAPVKGFLGLFKKTHGAGSSFPGSDDESLEEAFASLQAKDFTTTNHISPEDAENWENKSVKSDGSQEAEILAPLERGSSARSMHDVNGKIEHKHFLDIGKKGLGKFSQRFSLDFLAGKSNTSSSDRLNATAAEQSKGESNTSLSPPGVSERRV
ncbi:hypothetical protein HK100_007271, partial [Physocladia obscura]